MKELINLLGPRESRAASGVRRLAAALASEHQRAPQTPSDNTQSVLASKQPHFEAPVTQGRGQIHQSNNPSIPSCSASSVPSVSKTDASNESAPPDLDDALENLELQLEHAQSMAQDSPNVFLKASMNIASMEIFSVLNRFDSVTLSKRLDEKPELYFRLMNSQFSLMRAHLDQQKFEFRKQHAEARQRDRDQKLRARKPILITASTLSSLSTNLASEPREAFGVRRLDAAFSSAHGHAPQTPASVAGALGCSRRREEAHSVSAPRDVIHESNIEQPAAASPVFSASSVLTSNPPREAFGVRRLDAAFSSAHRHAPQTPASDIRQPASACISVTGNTGTTELVDVCVRMPNPEPPTLNPEPVSPPVWSDAAPEELLCSPP